MKLFAGNLAAGLLGTALLLGLSQSAVFALDANTGNAADAAKAQIEKSNAFALRKCRQHYQSPDTCSSEGSGCRQRGLEACEKMFGEKATAAEVAAEVKKRVAAQAVPANAPTAPKPD